MGTTDGTLELRVGESSVLVELDFTERHEIVAGETISSVTTLTVLDDDGDTSSDLTISSVALNTAHTKVQFRVTVGSGASVENRYEIKCSVVLSGGATIVECQDVSIVGC